MLGGGRRGLSEGFRDALGSVEGRSLACSKLYVQGLKLLCLLLEESFDWAEEFNPSTYLIPLLPLFWTESCSPIG